MNAQERNDLIEKHMGLAYFYARKFCATNMEYEDLVQEGMLGLMDATDRFDPGRGVKFSTYAMWHIRKTIMEAIRSKNDTVRTPRRRPSKSCVSLGDAVGIIDDAATPCEILAEEEERQAVHRGIRDLPSREGIVIRLRHGIDTERMTLKQVGHVLGVCPERVRQIQVQAEERLRGLLGDGANTAERHQSAQPENE